MGDEREIRLEGRWVIAALFIAFLVWFFLGGGLQLLIGLL